MFFASQPLGLVPQTTHLHHLPGGRLRITLQLGFTLARCFDARNIQCPKGFLLQQAGLEQVFPATERNSYTFNIVYKRFLPQSVELLIGELALNAIQQVDRSLALVTEPKTHRVVDDKALHPQIQ